jgi:AraC-like DNA-binding protein
MDPRIAAAVDYIREHLAEPITIGGVAARVNLSSSRFAHLFRVDVGIPPTQFIRAVRMARARLLLERTFLSVKEVMTLVGCNDPSHFTRDYRAVHGMPPRQWRNAYGERRRTSADGHEGSAAGAGLAHVRQKSPRQRKRPREPGPVSYEYPQSMTHVE